MLEGTARDIADEFYAQICGDQPESDFALNANIANKTTLRDLLVEFAKSPEIREAMFSSNLTPVFKFDNDYYISSSFDDLTKRTCFFYHYAYLCSILTGKNFQRLLDVEVSPHPSMDLILLVKLTPAEVSYTITLSYAHWGTQEGELSLSFKFDNSPIFVVGFTIVPGYVVGLPDQRTLILSRMQGYQGRFEYIKHATKDLREISPQTALVSAIDGIAQALGLEHIVGVSVTNHPAQGKDRQEVLAQGYDEFFASLCGEPPSNGFFYFDVPLPEKPWSQVNQVKQGRRGRGRRKAKRELKAEIANQARAAFESLMEIKGDLSSQGAAAQRVFDEFSAAKRRLADQLAQARNQLVEQRHELSHANESLSAERDRAREELARAASEGVNWKREAERSRLERDRLIARPPLLGRLLIARGVPLLSRLAEKREIDRLVAACFDTQYYLDRHPDVRARGISPVLHYVRHGRGEGRAVRLAPAASDDRRAVP